MTTPTYEAILDATQESQDRLLAALADVDESDLYGDSELPGWTRGHVLAHLARSADAVNRLAEGVLADTEPDMYPGGPDGRAAAIEEGSRRPKTLMLADLDFSGSRSLITMRSIPADAHGTPVKWRMPVFASDLPRLRWREVEIHHVDLSIGYTPLSWSESFVEATLATELPSLDRRAPGIVVPDLPRAELLAWLIGRPTRSGLPELPAWP